MPNEPNTPSGDKKPPLNMSPEDYRRAQNERAARRRKKMQQRMLVLGAFALAAILLIVCIVMLVRSLIAGGNAGNNSTSLALSQSVSEFVPSYPVAADTSVWNLRLVNENNRLPENFTEDFELTAIAVEIDGSYVSYYFDSRIVDALNQMVADCNAVEGNTLTIASGFRSYERQAKNFEYELSLGKTEEEVKRYESSPGASDHHTGLAVKFVTATVTEYDELFATMPEYQWLVENAANYGFILRYPGEKEAVTGMAYLPYHWRYVGVEEAAVMNNAGICLEEYVRATSAVTVAPVEDSTSNTENGTSLEDSTAS